MIVTVSRITFGESSPHSTVGAPRVKEPFTFSIMALVSIVPCRGDYKDGYNRSYGIGAYCKIKLIDGETYEIAGTHDDVLADIRKQAKAF